MPSINQVKILLRHNKKYLLLQKRKDVHADHVGGYEVPGGKVKPLEDHIQAVHRELKEETGLSCTILAELTPLVLEKDSIKTITKVFLGNSNSTKIILSSEHIAFKWVLPEEVDRMENVIYKDLLKKYLVEAESFS